MGNQSEVKPLGTQDIYKILMQLRRALAESGIKEANMSVGWTVFEVKMNKIESTDRIYAIRFLLKVMRWVGLWKWQDENETWSFLKRLYPYVLHIPITINYIVLMWVELLGANNLDEAGNVLYMSLTVLSLLVQLFNLWYRRVEAWQYINEVECSSIYELRTEEEAKFWREEQAQFRRVFYTFCCGCNLVAITSYISVLLQDTYVLPFSYYVPFEWRNPRIYFYAWGYNVLAMSLCVVVNTLMDTINCYFMFHIGLLYRLLGQRFLALKHTPEREALKQLRQAFHFHRRLQRLQRQCQLLVSPSVLSQVVLSALIICFSGFRLVQLGWQQNPGQFLVTVQFVAAMIFQIFLPCYYGNQLTVHANQLTNCVFAVNWLEYSVSTRKLLNCYMEQLKRPVKIRAGVFFEIGLPIFMKTINNAYSFFALLLNMSK